MAIDLIYCADGSPWSVEIAVQAGFAYGAQLPNTIYHPPVFVDQNWRKPDLKQYTDAIAQHRPQIATVQDWEREEQLSEVIAWAESIAPYVEIIVIIPKVVGGIGQLPRVIAGKPVRLGYSVPTSFGGTPVPMWEFYGWPVHLLGGSPKKQIELAHYLNVQSLDGNYHLKMATRYNQFFVPDGSARYASNRWWPTLKEASDGIKWGDGSPTANAPHEAFRRSCKNIMAMWKKTSVNKRPGA
jgi:hypothetical protein